MNILMLFNKFQLYNKYCEKECIFFPCKIFFVHYKYFYTYTHQDTYTLYGIKQCRKNDRKENQPCSNEFSDRNFVRERTESAPIKETDYEHVSSIS